MKLTKEFNPATDIFIEIDGETWLVEKVLRLGHYRIFNIKYGTRHVTANNSGWMLPY